MSQAVLVTGVAGLIGSHVAEALLARGDAVVGLDNLNDYYSPARKRANLAEIAQSVSGYAAEFRFVEGDVRDRALVARLFGAQAFDVIVHLAAMAGVRPSVAQPELYFDVNLNGTLVLLEAAVGRLAPRNPPNASGELGGALEEAVASGVPRPRGGGTRFVFGSTSSVYGASCEIPFVETDPAAQPLVPYAASKRAAELLGHTYHHLYGLHFTALRFFTVYGPRGRPDMMAYKLAESVYHGLEVPLYAGGQLRRDWTYVADVVSGVLAAVDRPLGYEIVNLGRGEPVLLADFVRLIEAATGRRARLVPAPQPAGDMRETHADIGKARRLLGYAPTTSVDEGVRRFLAWYERVINQLA